MSFGTNLFCPFFSLPAFPSLNSIYLVIELVLYFCIGLVALNRGSLNLFILVQDNLYFISIFKSNIQFKTLFMYLMNYYEWQEIGIAIQKYLTGSAELLKFPKYVGNGMKQNYELYWYINFLREPLGALEEPVLTWDVFQRNLCTRPQF